MELLEVCRKHTVLLPKHLSLLDPENKNPKTKSLRFLSIFFLQDVPRYIPHVCHHVSLESFSRRVYTPHVACLIFFQNLLLHFDGAPIIVRFPATPAYQLTRLGYVYDPPPLQLVIYYLVGHVVLACTADYMAPAGFVSFAGEISQIGIVGEGSLVLECRIFNSQGPDC